LSESISLLQLPSHKLQGTLGNSTLLLPISY